MKARFNRLIRYTVAFLLGGSFVFLSAWWTGYTRAVDMLPRPGETTSLEADAQTPWPVSVRLRVTQPPTAPPSGPGPAEALTDTGRGATL